MTSFAPFLFAAGAIQSSPPSGLPQTAPQTASAPHLVAAHLPLKVGNRWTYSVTKDGKKLARPVAVEITRLHIQNFRTYYAFNRFPFTSFANDLENAILRWDTRARKFIRLSEEGQEVELFPLHEATTSLRVEKQTGRPEDLQRLGYAECEGCEDGALILTFEFQKGIVHAEKHTSQGHYVYELISFEGDVHRRGEAVKAKEPKLRADVGPPKPIYSEQKPTLKLEMMEAPEGLRLTLTVKNDSEKLMPLNFPSGQSFDFVAREPETKGEVWRWSKGHYFTKVVRREGLQPGQSLRFQATWHYCDPSQKLPPANVYEFVGVLAVREPHTSEPITKSLTPCSEKK